MKTKTFIVLAVAAIVTIGAVLICKIEWRKHQCELHRYDGWAQLRVWGGKNGRVSNRYVISWRDSNQYHAWTRIPTLYHERLDYNDFGKDTTK